MGVDIQMKVKGGVRWKGVSLSCSVVYVFIIMPKSLKLQHLTGQRPGG